VQPNGPEGWPKAGARVCYSPRIEGATGGAECRPAVIAAYHEGVDDVFAELRTVDGVLIDGRSMRYESERGHWLPGEPKGFCGGTWHTRCRDAMLLLSVADALNACEQAGIGVKLNGAVITEYGYVLPTDRGWSTRTLAYSPFGAPEGGTDD
jgi:hypothetical protein